MPRPSEDAYGPCSCGSGQKYKFCCREKDRERRREVLRDVSSVTGAHGEPILILDLEEAERLHLQGLNLVERGRGREAIPILEKAIHAAAVVPQLHNNLALAHFLAGDVPAAIETAERVDRAIDPGNTFALGNLVHFHLVAGGTRDAERAGGRLRGRKPESEDAAVRMSEAFARLGWHEDLLAATSPEPWRGVHRARIAFLQGTAAANLGRYPRAQELLRGASRDPDHRQRAKRYLDLLDRRLGPNSLDGDWPYFGCFEWVPPDYLERRKPNERLRSLPGIVPALVAALNDDPDHGDLPLRALGQIGTPAAVGVLRRVVSGTFGSESLRFTAMTVLRGLGELDEGTPIKMWHAGEWKEIELREFELTDEAASAAPPWLVRAAKKVVDAMQAGDHARAEKLGRDLLARAPGVPMVLQNLAAALAAAGKLEEAETLLARAMALDPGYVFAPATLASLRVEQGRTEEARKILKSMVLPKRMHPQACASFLAAEARVAQAEGNVDEAANALEALESLPGEGSSRGLAARLAAGFRSFRDRLRGRRDRQRRRLLAPDAGLRECLAGSTREQMGAMAAALGLAAKASLGKEALLDRVAACLSDPGRVLTLVDSLPAIGRVALDDVLARGGVQAYADFTRTHGSDRRDADSARRIPETPLGRLKAVGLVAEGVVGGQESVVVPVEIRRTLAGAGEGLRLADRRGTQAHG